MDTQSRYFVVGYDTLFVSSNVFCDDIEFVYYIIII